MPSLENRKIVARLIRDWQAEIVMAHRPYHYHADDRYTGVLLDWSGSAMQPLQSSIRDRLRTLYGTEDEKRGYAETFQLSQHSRHVQPEELKRLFRFRINRPLPRP